MWYIVLVAAVVSVAKAQVFGALGCPTVKPQASFDLQKVSAFYLQKMLYYDSVEGLATLYYKYFDFMQFLCA